MHYSHTVYIYIFISDIKNCTFINSNTIVAPIDKQDLSTSIGN